MICLLIVKSCLIVARLRDFGEMALWPD